MAKKLVNIDSFAQDYNLTREFKGMNGEMRKYEVQVGTVEVTLRGKTKRCPAEITDLVGWQMTVTGLTGRYQTGTKAWPAIIMIDDRGECAHFGRDDRDSKFQKMNGLHFKDD